MLCLMLAGQHLCRHINIVLWEALSNFGEVFRRAGSSFWRAVSGQTDRQLI